MTLDLHGIKHEDVERIVENTVLPNPPPHRIITGNSLRMKELVVEVLKKHNFTYSDFGPSIIVG